MTNDDDGRPLPSDDRRLRRELRERDRLAAQAYDTGLAGEPFDPGMWPDDGNDITDAYDAGAAQRRHDRRPDRMALALSRQMVPRRAVRRRAARWGRRHPWVAGFAAAAILAALVVAVIVVTVVVVTRLAGRGVQALAHTVHNLTAPEDGADDAF